MQFTGDAVVLIVGRLLLGGFYVYGGAIHFFEIPKLVERMSARGVPLPFLTLMVGSVFQAAVGISFIVGFHTSCAAYGLIAFTIIASLMFLNFWDMQDPARTVARNNLISNVALIGGLFIAAAQS